VTKEANIDKSSNEQLNLVKYEKPELKFYGDVRDITLGASVAGTESLATVNDTCQAGIDLGCPNP